MKKVVTILLLLTLPLLQGCAIGWLVAGVGYGVGQGRKASAKMIEAKAKYTEQYTNYKVEMEKINLEREKAGFQPQPIMLFDEWLDTQPLTASEIKLFKKYKASTTKELKEQNKSE